MRALRELPELGEKVESGELKVTQLAQVRSFLRSERKVGISYSLAQKRNLIQSTVGKSTRETERFLAEKNPDHCPKDNIRTITANRSLITFHADDALLEELQKVRDRFAHRLPSGASIADTIRFMAKMTLAMAPEGKERASVQKPKSDKPAAEDSPLPAPVVTSRYIPAAVKRRVWLRDRG